MLQTKLACISTQSSERSAMFRKLFIAGLVIIFGGSVAGATIVTVHGTTVGGPNLYRPVVPWWLVYGTIRSGPDSAPYAVNPFYTDTSEHFDIASYASNFVGSRGIWDNFFGLYRGSFNPLTPLNNLVFFNDDIYVNGIRAAGNQSTFDSEANVQYFAVTTGVNGESGVYTLQLASHGNIRTGLIASSVPEPVTWSIMLVGFGVAGSRLRALRRAMARPSVD